MEEQRKDPEIPLVQHSSRPDKKTESVRSKEIKEDEERLTKPCRRRPKGPRLKAPVSQIYREKECQFFEQLEQKKMR